MAFRFAIFQSLHNLSHPGIEATQRFITTRYACLTNINRDNLGTAFTATSLGIVEFNTFNETIFVILKTKDIHVALPFRYYAC